MDEKLISSIDFNALLVLQHRTVKSTGVSHTEFPPPNKVRIFPLW